jgi:hypothetical protein
VKLTKVGPGDYMYGPYLIYRETDGGWWFISDTNGRELPFLLDSLKAATDFLAGEAL